MRATKQGGSFGVPLLSFIIIDLEKYLSEYKQNKNYNEIFTDNTQINLANLEVIYSKLDNIIELIENITLLETQVPTAEIYDIDDYKKFPDFYDEDIDLSNLADSYISELSRLKLYKNDKFNKVN